MLSRGFGRVVVPPDDARGVRVIARPRLDHLWGTAGIGLRALLSELGEARHTARQGRTQMADISVTVQVEAAPERVWEELTAWERQPDWMVDALQVVVRPGARTGTGVVIDCPTNILAGIVVTDTMEVTVWEPPHVIGIRHLGRIIRGTGTFELRPRGAGTLVCWCEQVPVPLGPVGDVAAAMLVVPWVRRTFRRSLEQFKVLVEHRDRRADAVS